MKHDIRQQIIGMYIVDMYVTSVTNVMISIIGGVFDSNIIGFNHVQMHISISLKDIIIIISYPLTARVTGAPQMILQPVSSIFPCSPLLPGTWRTPGL